MMKRVVSRDLLKIFLSLDTWQVLLQWELLEIEMEKNIHGSSGKICPCCRSLQVNLGKGIIIS
eukprot:8008830-Prorocentrum_lima.AAC.1